MNYGAGGALPGKCGLTMMAGERDQLWPGRRVLVTGCTGFVASWLCDALCEAGAHVVGVDHRMAPMSNFKLLGLDERLTVVTGSITDFFLMQRLLNENGVEIVFHLAAQAIVGVANRSPVSTFESNIRGTWTLLEAARGVGTVEGIVVASSDKAYGVHDVLPYREDSALQPLYPYDVSKACADMMARCYCHTYDLPVCVTRFANIYGGGDLNFSRIVPDAMRSIVLDRNPVIRSDGTPERDLLYVEDAVDLYLTLARNAGRDGVAGEAFNAGSGRPISVLNLVKRAIASSGKAHLEPDVRGKAKPGGEIDSQFLDSTKVERTLGWRPGVSLDRGLASTYRWYEANLPRLGAHRLSPGPSAALSVVHGP